MIRRININPTFADQTQEIVLGAAVYRLRLAWNTRMELWTLDLSTRAGDPILSGIPVVLNYDLIGRFADARLPRGFIVAFDSTQSMATIGRLDLGRTVPLLYVPLEALA
jgi:hypothetical protein